MHISSQCHEQYLPLCPVPRMVFSTKERCCLRTWGRKKGGEGKRGFRRENWERSVMIMLHIDFQLLSSIYGKNLKINAVTELSAKLTNLEMVNVHKQMTNTKR